MAQQPDPDQDDSAPTPPRARRGWARLRPAWSRWRLRGLDGEPARAAMIRRGSGAALRRLRSPSSRRALIGLSVISVALVGAALGLVLGARTAANVGPFNAEIRVTPSIAGETAVAVPPLGSLSMNTHDGPTRLTIQLSQLDQARTQKMINDPGGVTRAANNAAEDMVDGVIRVGAGSLGAAVLGAMVLAALVFRNVRRVAWSGGLALAVMAASLGAAGGSFRLGAVQEPRYEGLLVNAPALVGDVERIADDYQRYTDQLQRMVSNVSTLYTAASTLNTFAPDDTMTRALHVSDLHLNPAAWTVMRTIVQQYDIDLIIDTGDIVDWGSGPETEYLQSIRLMGVPYVYVRGNHDSESVTEAAVAEQPNAIVLNDEVVEVAGLTVAGIGDPRFTPDQRTDPHGDEEVAAIQQQVVDSGRALAFTITQYGEPVDVALVHDPRAAEPLDGVAPLVLAGHTHNRQVGPVVPPEEIGEDGEQPPVEPGQTRLMVQGSTGGAGLRGLESDDPEPLAMSVLYFNGSDLLAAYDDITVGGHGLSEASVQRTIIDPPPAEAPQAGP